MWRKGNPPILLINREYKLVHHYEEWEYSMFKTILECLEWHIFLTYSFRYTSNANLGLGKYNLLACVETNEA